ncbi:hypothetical protein CYMTET_52128 [Cymbomonas tetramitiformis]|uniref:Uncharacterized protein n=1 Tax=Cymbomonas tetramitiformis TaxID=36881 RepID=A0AAE0BJR9_9CHLO|nr:hypothetical protein CYMTET_52128 [Cymbomonas tetramitiformis]
MEEDPTVTFGVASYSELFTKYTREQGLRPIQPKKPWGPQDMGAPRGGTGRRAGLSTSARNLVMVHSAAGRLWLRYTKGVGPRLSTLNGM